MAVHVIPYNPWREQLALTALGNVAGDIIGDMWKAHRQNEQNRKANAFRGQLQQDLQNTAQDNISLMPQKAPTGYNANPWAAAFHQGNNPVAQFDMGTSAIGKTPSLQDIARASDTLAASPRFSMLDQKTVNDIRDNMMRNTIGDMFGNAGDITGQMNALTMGAAMGLVAPQVLAAFGPFGQKMAFPYSFGETDIGQSKVITARNEHTGEITPGLIMPVSVSPDTAATVQGSKDVANIHAGATRDAANIHAQGDYARAQATIHAKQLEIWQKQYDALKAEIDNDIANLADIKNEKDRAIVQDVIAQKRQKLAQLEQLMAGGYQGMTAQGAGTQGAGTGTATGNYDELISQASQTHKVDEDLIYAVMQVESGHRNGLTSSAGAQGLMQLMPGTAKRFGVTDVWNPEQNINGGVAYLKWLLDRYNGNEEKALQAYNCGEGRVARDGTKDKNNVPAVSVQYAKNVLAIANRRRAARKNNSEQPQQASNVSALRDSQPTAQETPQTTTQGQTKSDVTAWVNEYDPAFMENVRKSAPTDPVAYMSDQYGNYFTQDEIQREAARKNISADVYENQLRAQGFRKSGEDFSNDTAAAPVTALSDSQSVPPFPVNYRDHNRRNFATHTAGNPKAGVAPAWSLPDWLNRYINTENTMRPPAGIQPAQNNLYHIPGFNVSGNPFSAMLPAVAQGGGGNQAQFMPVSALGYPILGDFSNIYGTGNITGNDIFRVMPPFSVLTPENYRRFYGLP